VGKKTKKNEGKEGKALMGGWGKRQRKMRGKRAKP